MTKTTLITLGITSLLACNLSGKIDAAIDQLDIFCTPGEEIECSCEDGEEGSQTCQAQGTSFSDCLCENSSALSECTPGEMDACVCEGTEDLGARTCLGNKEWDDCFCASESEIPPCEDGAIDSCACSTEEIGTKICQQKQWQDCTCSPKEPEYPANQWILRDKNGDIINAVFEPKCIGETQGDCLSFSSEKDYPCISLQYLDTKPVWVNYDIKTGSPVSCYTKQEAWYGFYFDNADCSGTPYSTDFFGLIEIRELLRKENKLYWTNPESNEIQISQPYSLEGESCTEIGFDIPLVHKITEIPSEIYELLPNGPYTISLE